MENNTFTALTTEQLVQIVFKDITAIADTFVTNAMEKGEFNADSVKMVKLIRDIEIRQNHLYDLLKKLNTIYRIHFGNYMPNGLKLPTSAHVLVKRINIVQEDNKHLDVVQEFFGELTELEMLYYQLYDQGINILTF